MSVIKIPEAPNSIQKGVPLKLLLDKKAINQLAVNLQFVTSSFNKKSFVRDSLNTISSLSLMERSNMIAEKMKCYLPEPYSKAIKTILKSLTSPLKNTENNGLAGLFYLPHGSFIAKYGIDEKYNNGNDPFEVSMNAQYELTQRFSCEFSIRHFIVNDSKRTFKILHKWMKDVNPHVRRLCSEGSRPRLPWSMKLSSIVQEPSTTLLILETLKNDEELYVRRSVANHIGDIAKDNLNFALELCESWLAGASVELKWVIRHALRNPCKKGNPVALKIRENAK